MGRSKKPVVKKSRATSRARGNGRRALPPPPSPIGRVTSGSLRPEQIVTFDPNLVQRWNRLSNRERELYCRFCGNESKSRRARRQHMAECHVGKRCHYPRRGRICGLVFEAEGQTIDHLNTHLRPTTPAPNSDGKRMRCGWPGPCSNSKGFTMQESMFRHVRKHQVKAARAAGDVVDGLAESDSDTDADDDDDDTESIDDIPDGRNGKDDHQGPPPSGSVGQEILAN